MSLIDEALKRAQQAHDREADQARRPWAPAPLPDSGVARRRRLLVGATLAAVGALGVAGLVLLRRSPVTKPAAPSSERPALPTPVPPTPGPFDEVRVPPPPRGIAAAPAPKPTAGPVQGPALPAGAPAAPRGPAAAPPLPASPASAERPGGLASGRTYTGSVALPAGGKLELEGIVYSETNATAVINGRILGEGASVEGFTVTRIEENRVTLSGSGLTFYLAVR